MPAYDCVVSKFPVYIRITTNRALNADELQTLKQCVYDTKVTVKPDGTINLETAYTPAIFELMAKKVPES